VFARHDWCVFRLPQSLRNFFNSTQVGPTLWTQHRDLAIDQSSRVVNGVKALLLDIEAVGPIAGAWHGGAFARELLRVVGMFLQYACMHLCIHVCIPTRHCCMMCCTDNVAYRQCCCVRLRAAAYPIFPDAAVVLEDRGQQLTAGGFQGMHR